MRKSRMVRTLALVMGVWLSLVQSDAGLFHACATGNRAIAALEAGATDDVPPVDPQGAHHAALAHTHHAAGHHEGATAVPDAAQSADAPDTSHHHPSGDGECHCIGHCCVATPPALRAPDTFALVVLVRTTTQQPGRAAHAVVAEWADYVLPFATAPPPVIGA